MARHKLLTVLTITSNEANQQQPSHHDTVGSSYHCGGIVPPHRLDVVFSNDAIVINTLLLS
jgi:hypothetical protein